MLALAHVLRRPIVVVADTVLKDMNGDALAPINFGGVYLPLECAPADCHRSPLLLTYNAGHFSALVAMEQPLRGGSASGTSSATSPSEPESPWVPAVVPLTDSEHTLLPLHFSVDPGAEFCWNRDEFEPDSSRDLALSPPDRLNLLDSYLEAVKVALPEWYLDQQQGASSPSPEPEVRRGSAPSPSPSLPQHLQQQQQQQQRGRQRQQQPHNPSVAKQFGSLGKKLRKNLGKLARSSSLRRTPRQRQQQQDEADGEMAEAMKQSLDNYNRQQQQQQQQQQRRRLVGSSQPFILSAFIQATGDHVRGTPPYRGEMVENYLQEARRRFEAERESKKRQREEREEAEERRKREIYLNGGYRDCATPGCRGRAACKANGGGGDEDQADGGGSGGEEGGGGEAKYLCTSCLAEQRRLREEQGQIREGNSRFYAGAASSSSSSSSALEEAVGVDRVRRASSPSDGSDVATGFAFTPEESRLGGTGLRVKLPPPSAGQPMSTSSSSTTPGSAATSPRPCRSPGTPISAAMSSKTRDGA